MPLTQLAPPYPIFTDKNGDPLDAGFLYFGVADQNPETNPIQVYWDNALTQPAAQPIRTINGYPSRNGSPAAVYTNDYFSITVRNKRNELVIYAPSGYGITPGTSASFSDQITYNEGSNDAVDRSLTNRLQEKVSVKDFGAVGDGVTNDGDAFDTMATEIGYINVPRGTFSLNTRYIDVPIFFETGGMITIPAGQTVTIRNRISASSKQQIFAGDGQIYLENDSALGIGEDSKHAYAAWWGIFAIGQTNTIQTALFNKALSAYTSQTREGIFELDCGSYRIDGTVTIPRGVWFKGAATRRTIIDLVNDGYTALEAGGAAVKITGIQFEQPAGDEAYFDGTQISCQYNTPYLQDIVVWNARIGIHLGPDAFLGTVKDVRGIYGREPLGGYPSGSAMVLLEGSNCYLENLYAAQTSFSVENVVLVKADTSALLNAVINGVYTTEISIPVKLISTASFIEGVSISNINCAPDAGLVDAAIDIETSGTGNIRNVAISNITINERTSYFLKIAQGSSGATRGISLSSAATNNFGVKAASLIQTAGTLEGVALGSSVIVREDEDFIFVDRSGTMSNIIVPNHLFPILDIGDDGVDFFEPFVVGGILAISNRGQGSGFPSANSSGAVYFDVGASDNILKMYGGPNLETLPAGTVPTGTTGTDGALSVSAVDTGRVYFENRTGGNIRVFLAMVV